MNTQEFKPTEHYIAPLIDVIEVELSQNILDASGTLPPIGDGGDAW